MLALLDWDPTSAERPEFAFMPARVLLQDFTGRALRGRPGRHAVGDGSGRGRSVGHRRGCPGRPGDRPLGAGGHCRRPRCLRLQHGHGDAAQRRALRAAALGPRRVRQPQGGPAGSGHLPPGEPGIPCPGCAPGRRVGRRSKRRRPGRRGPVGLPRHRHRHRLAHHHDQRPGRPGLGRGRHRGRGGHAGAAVLHAGAAGRRGPPCGHAWLPRPPPPTSCSPSPNSCARSAWSTASSNTSAPAPNASPWPTGLPSPTWPPSTGLPAVSSRWTARRSPTCARRAVRTTSALGWKPTAASNPCSGKQAQRTPNIRGWSSSTWPTCGPAWPVPGARKSGCCSRRCPRSSTRACPPWLRAGPKSPWPRPRSPVSANSSTTAMW